jgi:DAK2 domain fusion protein YloV
MDLTLSPDAFRAWVRLCVENLRAARAEIDALNVFPVPDRDTGTNAYLTFVAGAEALDGLGKKTELPVLVKAFADGMLTGAKGNCGVILSQLVRAFVAELGESFELTADDIVRSFAAGARAGYAAVGRPVEGTILTVAAAAADGAAAHADGGVRKVFAGAAAAAREALARTPMQMDRLAQAGVVDSGGRALVVVLDSTEQRLTGRVPDRPAPFLPTPFADETGADLVEGGPSYEVMFLLEADDDRIPSLRAALDGLGDSLVVVGGDRLWNVHVHVDDVGAVIEAGMAAGRPYRVSVTHFAEQIEQQVVRPRTRSRGRAVISAVTGEGLADLCRSAGADVLEFTRSRSLTAEDMRKALQAADADEIVALPNNHRFRGLFEAAAKELRAEGVRVAIIPTLAQVQGLAALAVHDPGMGFDDDVVAMASAAAAVKHGAVTVATEPGITMVGPCQVGDALGIISGEFSVVSADLAAAACDVVGSLVTPGSELVTLVSGVGGSTELTEAVEEFVREHRIDLDVVVHEGGQENYPLFIAVE